MIRRPTLFPSAFHPQVGGVEELTRQLAREQIRRRMAPLVVANRWPRDLAASETVDGLEVRRLPWRTPGRSARQLGGWAARTGRTHRETATLLSEWGADIVHVQCVSANAHFAGRAARRLDLPFVVSSQGELSMDPDRLFERSALARRLLSRTLGRADAVTGCSRFVVDELDRFTGGRHRHKLSVVPNGIDPAECAAARPEERDRPYVLGLGRLVDQKGFDVLARAFARLPTGLADHELVLAGGGPAAAGLRRLVADLGIGKRTELTGPVDHGRALALMAGSAAFVLPSRHEPQGIVVLEAMAAGAPVVAASVGGVPEVVDGTNGLLFPRGDVAALAASLTAVLTEPAAAEGLRTAGRATAERYSWSALADRYQAVYEEARRA